MTPGQLYLTCEQAGLHLRLDGAKLKAYGKKAMIDQYLPLLKTHKEKLKIYLEKMDREYFDERAAIAEYEGGLSRDEAEASALTQWEARQNRRNFH